MRNCALKLFPVGRATRRAYRVRCAAIIFSLVLSLWLPPLVAQSESSATTDAQRTAVLLHGLGRTKRSMKEMAKALAGADYAVENIDYPSTDHTFEELEKIVGEKIQSCCIRDNVKIDFVTHSLGGILLRAYAKENGAAHIRRAVMLSPPSRGSELVDELKNIVVFHWIAGPAGQQLGTDADSVPLKLGPLNFEAGIITGTSTFNPLYSWIIPGPDDGKVSVERAQVSGMADFIALPHSHSFIMNSDEVIRQTLFFLEHGRFDH